ncbi:uncharacterized protein LOC128156107 [Crassostrea angulata]|uniref:Uncharacterized protein n=1 Tax=Magallana gigas TaxID=29159 RepID=K1P6B5_MAGGI|nr:uncharacterized protein LOC105347822 [Crassostrea gigas]XP_052674077.1 uncharacterized protein LOC128156107 [Crassostrea angulata]|eukprot:XP_011455361.1 PREDICTED: uncharacterized protein LOC105347822 [Crassostrea gigas]
MNISSAAMLRVFVVALWAIAILCQNTNGLTALENILAEETKDDYLRDVDDDSVLDQRTREEDLKKLILKKLRFRELPNDSSSEVLNSLVKRVPDSFRYGDSLVDKVAALLRIKMRPTKSPQVRMPSLRFG